MSMSRVCIASTCTERHSGTRGAVKHGLQGMLLARRRHVHCFESYVPQPQSGPSNGIPVVAGCCKLLPVCLAGPHTGSQQPATLAKEPAAPSGLAPHLGAVGHHSVPYLIIIKTQRLEMHYGIT